MKLHEQRDDLKWASEFYASARFVDVPSVSAPELKGILLGLSGEFNRSYREEVAKIIEILNPENTIKTKEMGRDWRERLYSTYDLNRVFQNVDDRVLKHIVEKCVGVPLMSLEYFLILLTTDHIKINSDNKVVATPKFEKCIELDNFTKILVPNSVHKRRLKNMDEFLKMGRADKKKVWQKELYVKGILVLKAAAVIGDEFGLGALRKILPLRQETHSSILHILKELELNDFIEILDESDPKDVRCRFNKAFLREAIYQIMLFKD